ncbi:hypothetical protein APE01nite_12350 [Acetobacter peroxydans]|uniref:Uncharacterized protein n=1 Tax=Acetobacter peroxydans TaxID=104098 RepID=A0A4Y3TUQ8_9PROT|nr:hypothetical protein AA0475_0059 [Acetobacter peroxydans]GEB85438.1 hypothetical protein APE01nite_12350 [Acetobacter peroxydans]
MIIEGCSYKHRYICVYIDYIYAIVLYDVVVKLIVKISIAWYVPTNRAGYVVASG